MWRGGAILPGSNTFASGRHAAGWPSRTPPRQQWHRWGPVTIRVPNGALGSRHILCSALAAGIPWAVRENPYRSSWPALSWPWTPAHRSSSPAATPHHFDGVGGWRTFADPNLVLQGRRYHCSTSETHDTNPHPFPHHLPAGRCAGAGSALEFTPWHWRRSPPTRLIPVLGWAALQSGAGALPRWPWAKWGQPGRTGATSTRSIQPGRRFSPGPPLPVVSNPVGAHHGRRLRGKRRSRRPDTSGLCDEKAGGRTAVTFGMQPRSQAGYDVAQVLTDPWRRNMKSAISDPAA